MTTISKYHSNRRAYNWLAYEINDRFLNQCTPLFKGALYDLGAGESPYKEFFLCHATAHVAVDWSGSYHNIQADVLADPNEPLPIASEVADTVVSLSVLEHLRKPQTMPNESFRILKPGGHTILQVPWQWWIHEAPYDFFRYTPYGLEYLLNKAGYVDVKVEPLAGFSTMITRKLNYFSLRFVRRPWVVRFALNVLLKVVWYIDQKLAPLLDKLDKDWVPEASGYYVTARKA